MTEDFEFTVSELLSIVRKGKNMTISESDHLKFHLDILSGEHVVILNHKSQQERRVWLTDDQTRFVRAILPTAIRGDLPKIEDMMKLFGLGLETIFYHETEPYVP